MTTIRHSIFLFAVALTFASPAVHAENNRVVLPDIGSSEEATLSISEEQRLGEAFMRSVRQSIKLVDDPIVNDYVEALGNVLVGYAGLHPFDFSFFVVDDTRINAFAGPGGHIGVNSGLIVTTESESELASVMAHELAHVTQHHLSRSFESANKLSVPTAAAVIAGIILGARNPVAGEALLAAGIAGNAQAQLTFSRAHEQEADRVGIETLAEAGFDPRAMPIFFERLQLASRYYDSGAPDFLSTHPVTGSRIADSRGRAEQFPLKQVTDSVDYHLIRARLQWLADTQKPAQQVQIHDANLKSGKYRNEFAERYIFALSLSAAGQFDAAREQLKILLKNDKERSAYYAAQAQIEIAAKNYNKALEILNNGLKNFPHDTALTFMLCESLMATGQPKNALTLIQDQGRYEQGNPSYYQMLARAQELSGAQAEAHQSLAEYHYLFGRTALAVEHLQSALRLAGNSFYNKSRIEDRLKTFQEELRLLQKREEPEHRERVIPALSE